MHHREPTRFISLAANGKTLHRKHGFQSPQNNQNCNQHQNYNSTSTIEQDLSNLNNDFSNVRKSLVHNQKIQSNHQNNENNEILEKLTDNSNINKINEFDDESSQISTLGALIDERLQQLKQRLKKLESDDNNPHNHQIIENNQMINQINTDNISVISSNTTNNISHNTSKSVHMTTPNNHNNHNNYSSNHISEHKVYKHEPESTSPNATFSSNKELQYRFIDSNRISQQLNISPNHNESQSLYQHYLKYKSNNTQHRPINSNTNSNVEAIISRVMEKSRLLFDTNKVNNIQTNINSTKSTNSTNSINSINSTTNQINEKNSSFPNYIAPIPTNSFEDEIDATWNRTQLQFKKWHTLNQQFKERESLNDLFHDIKHTIIDDTIDKNESKLSESTASSNWALDTYYEPTPPNIPQTTKINRSNQIHETNTNNEIEKINNKIEKVSNNIIENTDQNPIVDTQKRATINIGIQAEINETHSDSNNLNNINNLNNSNGSYHSNYSNHTNNSNHLNNPIIVTTQTQTQTEMIRNTSTNTMTNTIPTITTTTGTQANINTNINNPNTIISNYNPNIITLSSLHQGVQASTPYISPVPSVPSASHHRNHSTNISPNKDTETLSMSFESINDEESDRLTKLVENLKDNLSINPDNKELISSPKYDRRNLLNELKSLESKDSNFNNNKPIPQESLSYQLLNWKTRKSNPTQGSDHSLRQRIKYAMNSTRSQQSHLTIPSVSSNISNSNITQKSFWSENDVSRVHNPTFGNQHGTQNSNISGLSSITVGSENSGDMVRYLSNKLKLYEKKLRDIDPSLLE